VRSTSCATTHACSRLMLRTAVAYPLAARNEASRGHIVGVRRGGRDTGSFVAWCPDSSVGVGRKATVSFAS
jgi:hypothetical protein